MRQRALLLCLIFPFLGVASGCDDPNKPETWIKKLRDPEHAVQAVRRLKEIGDPVAVEPLCELFKEFPSPTILKAIISFNDKRAIPTLISALDFSEDKYHNATTAAEALGKMKATEAIPALIKVLEREFPLKSRANLAKLSAIDAISAIGDKSALAALIKIADGRPEQQDFHLNKVAIKTLGDFGDAQAIPVLIRGLFVSSTVQGTSFPQARVALVQMGEAAIEPMLTAMNGKDEALNELGKELKFEEGIVVNKIAMVLGDMMAKKAIPDLLKLLDGEEARNKMSNMGVIEALGKISDAQATPTLVSLLTDEKANYKLRVQACAALTVIGDKAALPALLDVAEKGYVQGDYTDLREAAGMAYARIVGAEAEAAVPRYKAMIADPKIAEYKATIGVFQEALDRIQIAVECKDDAVCYGKKLVDKKLSLAQREKAGIMVGILSDGRNALNDLIAALPDKEPILRRFFLQSAKRLGNKNDAALVKTLHDLYDKDSKRKAKFLGGDLASEDKVALEVILKKG